MLGGGKLGPAGEHQSQEKQKAHAHAYAHAYTHANEIMILAVSSRKVIVNVRPNQQQRIAIVRTYRGCVTAGVGHGYHGSWARRRGTTTNAFTPQRVHRYEGGCDVMSFLEGVVVGASPPPNKIFMGGPPSWGIPTTNRWLSTTNKKQATTGAIKPKTSEPKKEYEPYYYGVDDEEKTKKKGTKPLTKPQMDLKKLRTAMEPFRPEMQWSAAIEFLLAMEEVSNIPHSTLYDEVIAACGRGFKFSHAMQVFNRMRYNEVLITRETFEAMIHVCRACKRPMEAVELLKEIKTVGLRVNRPTYNSVIAVCAEAGQLETVMELYHEMEASGVKVDWKAFTALIVACSIRGTGNGPWSCYKR